MRTTIELPDVLFRQAKRLAAERGETLKELFTEALQHEMLVAKSPRQRLSLPSVRVSRSAPLMRMTPAELKAADAQSETENYLALSRRR